MNVKRLGDREIAVIIDSLASTRSLIRDTGLGTPTIDSALAAIQSLVTPSTRALWLVDEDVTPTDWQAFARDALDPDPTAMRKRIETAMADPPTREAVRASLTAEQPFALLDDRDLEIVLVALDVDRGSWYRPEEKEIAERLFDAAGDEVLLRPALLARHAEEDAHPGFTPPDAAATPQCRCSEPDTGPGIPAGRCGLCGHPLPNQET